MYYFIIYNNNNINYIKMIKINFFNKFYIILHVLFIVYQTINMIKLSCNLNICFVFHLCMYQTLIYLMVKKKFLSWEMSFTCPCNDPPHRYGIHTLIFDNFNSYKKNSLNFLLMKIEGILSQHKFIQQHAIT